MLKYLAIYKKVVIHILLCNGSHLDEEFFLLIFFSVFMLFSLSYLHNSL
jgi:hypothetical protein